MDVNSLCLNLGKDCFLEMSFHLDLVTLIRLKKACKLFHSWINLKFIWNIWHHALYDPFLPWPKDDAEINAHLESMKYIWKNGDIRPELSQNYVPMVFTKDYIFYGCVSIVSSTVTFRVDKRTKEQSCLSILGFKLIRHSYNQDNCFWITDDIYQNLIMVDENLHQLRSFSRLEFFVFPGNKNCSNAHCFLYQNKVMTRIDKSVENDSIKWYTKKLDITFESRMHNFLGCSHDVLIEQWMDRVYFHFLKKKKRTFIDIEIFSGQVDCTYLIRGRFYIIGRIYVKHLNAHKTCILQFEIGEENVQQIKTYYVDTPDVIHQVIRCGILHLKNKKFRLFDNLNDFQSTNK